MNILYTTVVLCAPGSTTNCQIIDHVQVDTGSYGLRIISQALQPSLAAALPVVTESVSGQALTECTQFADGYSWGPVRSADVQIAGEQASGIEIQVIGDPTYQQVPTACSSYGTQEDTVKVFGANGIIGIGPFVQDCGAGCAPVTGSASNGFYYVCASPTSACTATTVNLKQQVSNPVAFFKSSNPASLGVPDNNGVIIQLPSVPQAGAPTVQGSMFFGIDTETNNSSASVTTVLPASTKTGNIWTQYNNQSLTESYVDSGSNAYYFLDGTLPKCQSSVGFYCPASVVSLSATIEGSGGSPSANVPFYVANADAFSVANSAFDDIAGCPVSASTTSSCPTTSSTFDWGLPFFFSRSVFTAIDCSAGGVTCKSTSQGAGPYVAF